MMLRKLDSKMTSLVTRRLAFVGQQDGIPERELQVRLSATLDAHGTIERGYLARVHYGSSTDDVVALCLVARRSDDVVAMDVGRVFASLFGRGQHLDIIFLSPRQEEELRRVCEPFFESSS